MTVLAIFPEHEQNFFLMKLVTPRRHKDLANNKCFSQLSLNRQINERNVCLDTQLDTKLSGGSFVIRLMRLSYG